MLIINWLKKVQHCVGIYFIYIMLNELLIWMYLYWYISFGGYHEMDLY